MTDAPASSQVSSKSQWILPLIIAVIGILISLFFWTVVSHEKLPELVEALKEFLPEIVFILGLSLTLLLVILTYQIQTTRKRAQSLEVIKQDIQKEISVRIHAEEVKQKLEKALLQGQKLQAIGTLAGGIAHDFNNILYAMIGYVEMAREDVPKDSQVFINLGKVLEAAHRGQELVASILAFSRRHHHEFKTICLKTTIEGVLGLLKPTIPASVHIEFQAENGEYTILGNQTQLHQVLVNIINNAVDAMDGEGNVIIHLSHLASDDEFLKSFPKIESSSYCRIDITDTGHGMDQSMIERIFEPFFTTKEVGKGTGLGLATVHAIIEEHRGEITLTSQLGHGTTFTLLLPEYQGEENG